MKKFFATLIAVSTLSTAALAAADDRAPVFPERDYVSTNSTTESFEVAPIVKQDTDKPNYLNWNQLR